MTQDDPEGLRPLLDQHLSWYPLMELRDFYKLIYQGVMGSEHLLTSAENYTQYLQDEFRLIQPEASQRLLEPVRGDETLFRLNLSPYKARHLELDRLTPSFLETAQIISGTRSELRAAWAAFVELCIHGHICNFDANVILRFSKRLEEADYPAAHHSEVYRQAYKPAYRLIAAKYVSALGMNDAG
jgi:hypothetical protein